jgi:hypothetical protein
MEMTINKKVRKKMIKKKKKVKGAEFKAKLQNTIKKKF